MQSLPPGRILASLFVTVSFCQAQNFVGLDFSNNIQKTNAEYPNNSTLGPKYYTGLQLDFANVAAGVDARISLNFPPGVSPGYEYIGYIPNYNDTPTGGGDLGVYYRSILGNQTAVTGGISYTISFYESGSNFGTSKVLSDLRFLVYDHDGEPGQSESIRTYFSDGLVGYQLHQNSGIIALNEGDSYRFNARGENQPETTADGGFIAYYQNTSSIRFDMFATTQPWLPAANNGIFAAFDGDLSVNGGTTSGFRPYVAVPEPSAAVLTSGAAILALFRRKRPIG